MNIRDIPLPLVLGENRRVHPTRVSINLAITPLSDASMALPQGESLPARGYVELFTCMGSAGVFRVRSPQDAYGMVTTTAELEHAIVEVGDYLVKAKYDEMMAANTAMQTIFSHYGGNKWQLGSVSALGSGQIALQANYDRVLEAMLAILEQKPDCMMSFDFSTSPWTVNIVSRGTTVTAEGRLARNVNSAKVIYDDTELCTRAYYEKKTTTDSTSDIDLSDFPTFDASRNYNKNAYVVYSSKLYQLPSGHTKDVTWANTTKTLVDDIPDTVWDYVDADTIGTYGRIEREVRTGSSDTAAEALRTVNEYLNKHKHPKVSVDISAIELSHITGESFDSFDIGKLFRLCLADYNNLTVEKNVINLYFENVYDKPESITVTLSEEEDTAITFIHDVDAKGGSGGGGGGGKKQDDQWKEYRTIFEQDDYHFGLYAQRLNTAEEVLQQAGLYIDANGVLIFAEDNERMIGSKLTVEANKIAMVVGTNQDGNYIKAAEIAVAINDAGEGIATINADHINISATSTLHTLAGELEVDAQGRLVIKNAGGMYVKKTEQGVTSYFGVWNDGNVTGLTVSRLINGDSSATINASKIYLLGETIANTITADYIASKVASLTILQVKALGCSGGASISGLLNAAGNIHTPYIELDGVSVGAAVYNVRIDGPTNNTYKLQKQTITGSGWVDCGSFSRAITSASWGWSGSAAKVTLSPQGQSFTSTLLVDNYSLTGSPTYNSSTGRISQHADIIDSAGDTITAFTISIDATAAYNAGWNACRQYAIDHNGSTVLTGYSTYNSGRSTSLYTEPSSSASIASGSARVWRYGGSTATRYTLPSPK